MGDDEFRAEPQSFCLWINLQIPATSIKIKEKNPYHYFPVLKSKVSNNSWFPIIIYAEKAGYLP